MNELMIFKYQNNEVRTIEINGEPWFVLKDVCDILEIKNVTQCAARLDENERSMFNIGRQGEVNIINESGLYKVIFQSKKPEAKQFTTWVTSDVLPRIRKTGGYIEGSDELSPAELMARAVLVAQKTLADREARISALTVENQIMKPKADYFDELVDRNLLTNFRETAKQFEVGPKAFVSFLIEHKYIYRDKRGKLMPYQQYVDAGLFVIKECSNNKTEWSGTQTLITPKGRETFRLLF